MTTDSEDYSQKNPRKRIRANHNELERVRRNNQKLQLDMLRKALPFHDMDDKASMVSIIVRAREYIEMLESRVSELQTNIVPPLSQNSSDVTPSSPRPNITLTHPEVLNVRVPSSAPRKSLGLNMPDFPESPLQREQRLPSISAENIHMHQGIQFYNPGFMQVPQPTITPTTTSPRRSVSPLSERGKEEAANQYLNADVLRLYVSDNFKARRGTLRLSSDEETNFMKGFNTRRSSSLLLPMPDDTVLIHQRDSISTLFSGLFPDVVGNEAFNQQCLTCNKCKCGMNNMIMIDCDKCHKWYHIKCANVDSNFIPTNWNCCE